MSDRGTVLLNDDGRASIATLVMMSHHAFRRDAASFEAALQELTSGDDERAGALLEEWKNFRGALHGHHEIEDTQMFPGLQGANPALSGPIAELTADHRQIDPLLEEGDRAFANLPAAREEAAAVIASLAKLLRDHLTREEASIIPHLRGAREFPPPATDEEVEMYAQGFAWSCHGIAPDVLESVFALLPARLTDRLPAARAAFVTRSQRAFGPARIGASRTSVPDWI